MPLRPAFPQEVQDEEIPSIPGGQQALSTAPLEPGEGLERVGLQLMAGKGDRRVPWGGWATCPARSQLHPLSALLPPSVAGIPVVTDYHSPPEAGPLASLPAALLGDAVPSGQSWLLGTAGGEAS